MKKHNNDYQISIIEFCSWVTETSDRIETFMNYLESIHKGIETIINMAIDYSIPIIMIKYFIKNKWNRIDFLIADIDTW